MKILLAVTGSIAAYKACSITSVLVDKGHEVQVVMTDNAQKFITPMSLCALSQRPVLTNEDEWKCTDGKIPHIYYTQEWCDIFVIVPATANIIGKILNGIADDIVSAMAIATPKSVEKMIYPAMNSVMLENAYMNKLGELKEKDWHLGDTQEKRLACGSVGKGALQSTKEIVSMMEYMYERWILNRKSKNEC